jgi:phosphatidylethanolamine/phosphatidyl-N-methylethanolamine N-methyltransferase
MDAVARFYDRVYFLYPLIDIFLKPQKRKLFRYINSSPPGQLLEIGVGNGANLKYYRVHQVTGIDSSTNMLKVASRAATQANKHAPDSIRLAHMNGEELLFKDRSFDYVTLSHVIAVVNNPERLMSEVLRVLRPAGKVFILNHFTPDNLLGNIDRMFGQVSGFLRFRSSFQITDLNMDKFQLVSETNAGLFSYFKILVYEKKL